MSSGTAHADTLSLSLGAPTVTFLDADPRATPSIPARENPNPISVAYTGAGNWVLTVIADGDILSGGDSIPINRVRWTAGGSAFHSGTMSKSSPQIIGTGTNAATGALSFFLANSLSYSTGNYSSSLTFTVTAF